MGMLLSREEEKSEGKRKRAAQGPTLSHTAGQEVLDGDTLPSCQHTDHQHWTPFSRTSHGTCDKYYGRHYHVLYCYCLYRVILILILHSVQDSDSTRSQSVCSLLREQWVFYAFDFSACDEKMYLLGVYILSYPSGVFLLKKPIDQCEILATRESILTHSVINTNDKNGKNQSVIALRSNGWGRAILGKVDNKQSIRR